MRAAIFFGGGLFFFEVISLIDALRSIKTDFLSADFTANRVLTPSPEGIGFYFVRRVVG